MTEAHEFLDFLNILAKISAVAGRVTQRIAADKANLQSTAADLLVRAGALTGAANSVEREYLLELHRSLTKLVGYLDITQSLVDEQEQEALRMHTNVSSGSIGLPPEERIEAFKQLLTNLKKIGTPASETGNAAPGS